MLSIFSMFSVSSMFSKLTPYGVLPSGMAGFHNFRSPAVCFVEHKQHKHCTHSLCILAQNRSFPINIFQGFNIVDYILQVLLQPEAKIYNVTLLFVCLSILANKFIICKYVKFTCCPMFILIIQGKAKVAVLKTKIK